MIKPYKIYKPKTNVLLRHCKEEKELQGQLSQLRLEIQERQKQASDLLVELTRLTRKLEESRESFTMKQTKWHQITDGTPASELQQQVAKELESIAEAVITC
ncbi:hypothetical protein skT53_32400 [Effusibacillus dendaii]|uniref:Uncharacterized protein n=1 Tax=Effusibacillus dendaii TaxID=2743772 RepID=A0A7I8DDT0_9BACL|nr:hypothetical protein skT53_32400 [Effusibacillus dendaii]